MFLCDKGDVHMEVKIEVASLGVGCGIVVGGVDGCRGDVIVAVVSIAVLVMLSAIATLFAGTAPPLGATSPPTAR